MTRPQRSRLLNIAFFLLGALGLSALAAAMATQPWLRVGVLYVLAYQSFWWSIRAVLATIIWRQEPALSTGQKLWFSVSAPLPVMLGVWRFQGKLSDWLTGEEDDVQ